MAKPTRSPLLGYNHNVKYGGHVFHVQTEDSGPGNPHIFTHLFFEGSILGSKRAEYDAAALDEDVRALMQSQHRAILKELKQRVFDERIGAFFRSRGQTFESEAFAADNAALVTPAPETAPPTQVAPENGIVATPVSSSEPLPERSPETWAATPPEIVAATPPEIVAATPPETLAATSPETSLETSPEASPETSPEASPEASPEPPTVEVQPGPPAPAAELDLDALPTTADEPGPTPEPLPMHLTKPAVPGPGTYTFRRPSRDRLATEPAAPPARMPSQPAVAAGSPSRIAPVVVQRQVVVGAGAPPATTTRKTPTTPVRRRPVSGGPYVVKEGSYATIAGPVRRAEATRPVVATPEPAKAPRTAEPPRPPQAPPPQTGAPAAFVTDQSLDDVILAYLSQGDGKP